LGLLRCSPISQRLNVLVHQFHDEPLIARSAPPIALNTADQPLAVVVDFDERGGGNRDISSAKPLDAFHHGLNPMTSGYRITMLATSVCSAREAAMSYDKDAFKAEGTAPHEAFDFIAYPGDKKTWAPTWGFVTCFKDPGTSVKGIKEVFLNG